MGRYFLYLVGILSVFASLSEAAIINVPAGGDFQAALNAASPGDTINLTAGAVYSTAGGFTLPNKGASTQVITIQSSALSNLPGAGYRVKPTDQTRMPRIQSSINGSPVLLTAIGAHHYRLLGLDITVASGRWSYQLVQLGDGTETQLSQLPSNITIERCYIHGDPTAIPGTKRGVQLNGISLSVLDSYISEIHSTDQDSQALQGSNGPGPFTILNNYLEASGENVLFGGSDPRIPNLVPSDIDFRYNHLFKPLSWKIGDPSYAGIAWSVKNTFELKNARRVTMDGNIFENCWAAGQDGLMIVFTPRNQEATAPWSTVRDVTFTHNKVLNSASAFNFLSADDENPSQPLQNVVIRNNLIDQVNRSQYGGSGRITQWIMGGATANQITFDHNTAFHRGASGGNTFVTLGDCCTIVDGLNFTNNIITHGDYGLFSSIGAGTAALEAFTRNYAASGNVIIGGGNPGSYPTGNHFASDFSSVGFVDFNAGNFQLAANSPYQNVGTDGSNPGADLSVVESATCGVIQGVPNATCVGNPRPPTCDLNTDGRNDVLDLQLQVNQALRVTTCTNDLNHDGSCNVVDVQRVINAIIGGTCVTS